MLASQRKPVRCWAGAIRSTKLSTAAHLFIPDARALPLVPASFSSLPHNGYCLASLLTTTNNIFSSMHSKLSSAFGNLFRGRSLA